MAVAARVLGFAGSAVAIEWEGEEAARLVSFLFDALPASPPVEPHITFRLESRPGDDDIWLTASSERTGKEGRKIRKNAPY